MDHRANRRFINPQAECDRSHQHAHLVRHPTLLIAPARSRIHLPVIRRGRQAPVFQKVDCLFHFVDGGRVNNHAAFGVAVQGVHQHSRLLYRITFADDVTQVRPVKAGNIFIRSTQLKLRQNVMPHMPSSAGRKRRNGMIGKVPAQPVQLPVFRTEFVSPLGNAVSFVDGEERDGNFLQPSDGVAPRQPLRRKIEQPVSSCARLLNHARLLLVAEGAIEHRRRDPHLRQLRRLILHQRNQRRNHHGSAP